MGKKQAPTTIADDYRTTLIKAFNSLGNLFSGSTYVEPRNFFEMKKLLEEVHRNGTWNLDIPCVDFKLYEFYRGKDPLGNRNISTFINHEAILRIFGVIATDGKKIVRQEIHLCLLYSKNPHTPQSGMKTTELSSCCTAQNELNKYHRVVRKFHFDVHSNQTEGISHSNKNQETPHPRFHLQYGGRYTDNYDLTASKVHYCLDHELDIPRIPILPTNLLSVFDMAMREFGILEYNNKYWRECVIESENIFTKKFISEMTASVGTAKTFHEFCLDYQDK